MFPILVVSLREGIEAFLIVAITAAYLKKTGRYALLPAVYWGTGVAVFASAIAAYFFSHASNKPLWEGSLALIAAALVVSMTVLMWKKARTISTDIREHVDVAASKPGGGAFLGIFAFVLLMISREGMETAVVVSTLMFQADAAALLTGAFIGIGLAALLAWAWTRYGHRIDLGKFFKVTAIFLFMFSVQLLIYAFHEFTEVRLLPIDNEYWHAASEPYGPDGQYGVALSFGLVVIPALWLVASYLFGRSGGNGKTSHA